MKEKPKIKRVPLRAYTKKELRKLYGISFRTWNEWTNKYKDELNIGNAYILTVKQVEAIFERFGVPGEIEID